MGSVIGEPTIIDLPTILDSMPYQSPEKESMSMRTLLISLAMFWASAMTMSGAMAAARSPGLLPEVRIEVSADPKRFDLMEVDAARHRLLAAHSREGTLTIIDLATDKLEREVPVGQSSGVAIDSPDGKYFVGTTEGVAVIDRNTLAKSGFISTRGPADAMIFDPQNDRLYVGHDDDGELWVIDPRQDKITGRIAIPGAPELMAIDPQSHRLYLNIKPSNEVVAIDPGDGKTVAHWSTLPTGSPHGLALDLPDRRLFVAGHSRTVSVFALPMGRSVEGIDIGPGQVDQIAFDVGTRRLYCPSSGRLVTVAVGAASDTVVGSVAIPQGTHSVAVDPRTHRVWIAYADKDHSYVQSFAPAATEK
jgi:DNA-binding beta-propeller fold protein YncE